MSKKNKSIKGSWGKVVFALVLSPIFALMTAFVVLLLPLPPFCIYSGAAGGPVATFCTAEFLGAFLVGLVLWFYVLKKSWEQMSSYIKEIYAK